MIIFCPYFKDSVYLKAINNQGRLNKNENRNQPTVMMVLSVMVMMILV